MRIGGLVVLSALLLGTLGLGPTTTSQGVELSLVIPGEAPIYNDVGQPVLIAGVWHQVTLSLTSPPGDSLILTATSQESQVREMSSYYRWERSEAENTWTDLEYDLFILPELSSSDGLEVLFHIGMDASAVPGPWRLTIDQDGSRATEMSFEVRRPEISYGLSSADFRFRAEPFESADLSSEDLAQYLRVINGGNIPLRLSVSFDKLQDQLSIVNPSDIAHIYEDARYYVRLALDPSPPRVLEVKGTSRVEVTHLIPSPGASQLIPAFEGEFELEVVVGRSGYLVESVGNVIFQTLQSLRADYNSLVTWQVFLTGSQQVSLNVEVRGARLAGVSKYGDRLELPAALTPSPQSELPLTVQVLADIPSTEAEVIFTLHLLETGEVRTFRTTILVGSEPPTQLGPSSLWIFASLISASTLMLVGYNHWKIRSLDKGGKRSKRGPASRKKGKVGGGNKSKGKKSGSSEGQKERTKKGGKRRRGKVETQGPKEKGGER